MDIHATLAGPVAAGLAKAGLTLVLTAGPQSRGDAWCDATAEHGQRIAHIHLQDGHWASMRHRPWGNGDYAPVTELLVSYPWDDTSAGQAIHETLQRHGLNTIWSGDPADAVRINL